MTLSGQCVCSHHSIYCNDFLLKLSKVLTQEQQNNVDLKLKYLNSQCL